jgi:hypothetical protein
VTAPRSRARARLLLLLVVALASLGVTPASAATTLTAAGHRASASVATVAGTSTTVHRRAVPVHQQTLTAAGQSTHPSPPQPPSGVTPGHPALSAPLLLVQLPRPPGTAPAGLVTAAPTGRSPPFSAGT